MFNDEEYARSGNDEHKGNGYSGISMSNNAVEAYKQGKAPLSKWKKKDILEVLKRRNISEDFIKEVKKINLPILKKYLLEYVEWHHTSLRYNETNFYKVTDIRNQDEKRNLLQKMKKAQEEYSKNNAEKHTKRSIKPPQKFYRVNMEYIHRSADGKHKKIVSGEGVIQGNWCHLKNRKKKKISGTHFFITKKMEEMPDSFSLDDYYDPEYRYNEHWEY